MTDADARRASGLGAAIKEMIAADNDRYYRLFDQLRNVATEATIQAPDISRYNLSAFEICEGPNEVTLSTKDFAGRQMCRVRRR